MHAKPTKTTRETHAAPTPKQLDLGLSTQVVGNCKSCNAVDVHLFRCRICQTYHCMTCFKSHEYGR
jgi:hypothetical protein